MAKRKALSLNGIGSEMVNSTDIMQGIMLWCTHSIAAMGVASNRQEEAIASSWILQIIQRPGWSIA